MWWPSRNGRLPMWWPSRNGRFRLRPSALAWGCHKPSRLHRRRRGRREHCFTLLRTSAARSREAWMSASDNLSTKCSGLLLRSSFAILAARTRHLFSVGPRPSNSSDIILRASSEPPTSIVGRLLRTRGSKVWSRSKGLGAWASTSKFFAEMNRTQDVCPATKGCSALPVNAEREGPNDHSHPLCLTCPGPSMAGAFSAGTDHALVR